MEELQFTNAQRAHVLTGALPYIRRYNGRIVAVKYGGNAMINETLREQVMEDIVLLSMVGVKVVLIHGGGPDVSDMMARLGKVPEFVDGLRVTDAETVEIAQMVLAGKVNKTLVKLLELKGGKAMGISGIDGHLIMARQKNPALGFVGAITEVCIDPIVDLLEKGYIPVVSTLGCDAEGNTYNINADTAASYIAGALGADRLIMMTDIAGVAVELFRTEVIAGGMIPKVECCIDAVLRGVDSAIIMDGRVPHSILMELLTDEGAGTMVVK